MRTFLVLMIFLYGFSAPKAAGPVFEVKNGIILFHSSAELELIKATSDQLKGLVDIQKRNFAFKVAMNSFRGFNSPLQQEHFNENYVESGVFPDASFQGKIIEDDDLTKDGTYIIRAKGILNIHGVPQERIIRSTVTVKQGRLKLNTTFTVLLTDHNIKIPRIVSEKLSSEIKVEIQADLAEKK
jgi:hypothetical protein